MSFGTWRASVKAKGAVALFASTAAALITAATMAAPVGAPGLATATTAAGASTTPPNCQGATPLGLTGNWNCTFDDEFNGTSLDTTLWQPQLTATSMYVAGPDCYVNNPNTISVSNGYLNLSAVRIPRTKCVGGYYTQYDTGMVTTRDLFTQTYGAFEVSAKLPQTTAKGLQETFWLYPETLTYGKWPASGEIDFAEFYSEYQDLDIPFVHYSNSSKDPNTTSHNCTIDPTQFNTYGLDWTPTTLTMLYNGNVCFTDTWLNGPAPFNQPFYIALTQALGLFGGNAVTANTPMPATTQIDWVRAWTPAS